MPMREFESVEEPKKPERKIVRCYFPEYSKNKDWNYNPCGSSKIVDGQMMCTRNKAELKSWGCLYKCEYEKPPR